MRARHAIEYAEWIGLGSHQGLIRVTQVHLAGMSTAVFRRGTPVREPGPAVLTVRGGSITRMEETFEVQVGEDHLAAFTRSPKVAIAELIWNGLDADATEVDVEYRLNALDGIEEVIVRDNGVGMTPTDANFGFRNFGNSWKRTAEGTPGGRTLHGKFGRGRYSAFSIGALPVWTSVAEEDGVRQRVRVTGSRTSLKSVRLVSDAALSDDAGGTTVSIDQLTDTAQRELLRADIRDDLTTRFAPYLEQYPDVTIKYRGNALKSSALRERTDISSIEVPGADQPAQLQIIEWKVNVERKLYLCDANGSALADTAVGVHAPGYQFTAYLRWAGFHDIQHGIILAELDSGVTGEMIATAKERIREYFKSRAEDKQKEIIKDWDNDGIYPYGGVPQTPTQAAERQAFDIVALTAASIINETTSARSRKLTLRLIKSALESGPTALQDVLRDVLELPEGKVNELRQLLDRTTLSGVIEASKRIANRLDFLSGLNAMIFDDESRKQTLERRQLHRILANETWVFGEEWALTGDDDRLTQVLARHLTRLGEDVELASLEPVLRDDGSDAIPDLVLSRTLETNANRSDHLVVELKRPSHRLTSADIDQIRSYAVAVAEDERFQQPNAHWDYVLVGNSTNQSVDDQREQINQPFGLVQPSKRYSIWVRTWAEIISDAEHRHKFVQRSLDYTTSRDGGIAYLREKHNEYLPEALKVDQPDG